MEVQNNIPAPKTPNGFTGRAEKGRPKKYPFHEMRVGESLFVDGQGMRGGAYKAARRNSQKTGRIFCAQLEANGIRIWRTE